MTGREHLWVRLYVLKQVCTRLLRMHVCASMCKKAAKSIRCPCQETTPRKSR